jgi:cytochrome oxidase Cu insertion factor (SCO1/SenC/PrrC family)
MRPGETQLWHISNQSTDRILHLAIAGHRLRIVGRDGQAVIGDLSSDVLDIVPAGRASVLIEAGPVGLYEIRADKVLTGTGTNQARYRVLGALTVTGRPTRSAKMPVPVPAVLDLRQAKVDATRTVTFSQSKDGTQFFVDGRGFDHLRTDIRVPLGHVEDWVIRNQSDDLHVFHIHQVAFQVLEVNGQPQPFLGYVDSVRLPEQGSIRIRLAFTQPQIVGRFVYHCHLLEHEDKGMMASIEVFDPKAEALRKSRRLHFALLGQDGRPVTDAMLAGRFTLIYFGYTSCGDLCPTSLAIMGEALDRLGELSAQVTPVMVTVDPSRDGPDVLAAYVAQFHPRFRGLWGREPAVAALARQLGASFTRAGGRTDYTIDHTSDIYLVGPDGRLAATFPYGTTAPDLALVLGANVVHGR